MSEDIATLGIRVDDSAVNDANRELRILIEVGTKAEKATDGLKNSFGGLKTAIAGLGVGALAREAIQMADTYSNVQGRLSLVTSGTGQLADVTEKLYQSAQRSRIGFEATADLYSSLARSTKSLGTTQGDLLSVTETINKALIVSGASAATAQGALVQLGQGFASGTLRGDELNSVLEGTPRLAQAIADGMKVSVGELRALGAEGKITGETVFNALKSQKDAVEKEFAAFPTTVSQSFVTLQNAILKYVGEANSASGTTSVISSAIAGLAHNIDTVVPVMIGLATALGIGYVTSAAASVIATSAATTSLAGLAVASRAAGSALLGMFGGPVGIAITAVTLGIVGFAAANSAANAVVLEVNKSYDDMQKKLAATAEAASSAAGGSRSMGIDSANAAPGIDSLTGSVKLLADMFYKSADAAKKARIEIAATALTQARANESKALALTPQGRDNSLGGATRGDFLGNASRFGDYIYGAGRSLLSGGRTDREAAETYKKAVDVSRQAKKDLDEAYKSTNSPLKAASAANEKEIKKLQGQVEDYKKLLPSLTGAEAKRLQKKIDTGERKIELLGTGASSDAVSAVGSGGAGKSGKSKAATDADQAAKASQTYADRLAEETAEIGKNNIETKLMAAQREAAKAPTQALKDAILGNAQAWASATIAQAASVGASKAASDQTEREAKAQESAMIVGKKALAQLEFENSLIGMSAEQRAMANAARDLENQGVKEGTLAWDLYGEAVVKAAGKKGALADQADEANRFADAISDINNRVKDATSAFGELFGTAGSGFASLVQTISDYAETSADAEAKIADARERYGVGSSGALEEEQRQRERMTDAELNNYGKVIGGVKNMFSQKSTAYKTLAAVEKAYAAVRLALAIKEIVTEGLLTTTAVAGAGARMATDGVETASSVAKSGIRAAADGVAAFAKTLASLPFPLNLVAGAAVLAALVGVGVAIAGGGGGKSASASASTEPAKPTDYENQESPYSVTQTKRSYGAGNSSGGYANDNASAKQAAANGDSYAFKWEINAPGADDSTVAKINDLLDARQTETVNMAREAVRNDRVAKAGRQGYGGVN